MIKANWPAPAHIQAFTTTREGGQSKAPFASNNLGAHVGDLPDTVSINRHRLSELLPSAPIWLEQTHTTKIHHITPNNINSSELINADASMTQESNIVCCVMTADCLPLLVTNKQGTIVAAIHAGWRGLVDGVIENTIEAINSKPDDLLVWLGPAIGPAAFEVGHDVYDLFCDKNAHFKSGFVPFKHKFLANIYQLATITLNNLGITQIYGGDYCTYTNESLFFSYRRDGKTGRMASIIWME